jgi:Fe-S cluster assembly protein SufD
MTLALPISSMERWKYSHLPSFVTKDYEEQPLAVGYMGDDALVAQDDVEGNVWASETYNDMQLWDSLQDILSLSVPEGLCVETPVTLSLDVEDDVKAIGHITVHLGKNSSLTLFEETHVAGWCNRSITIVLEEGASLTHIRTGDGAGIVTNLTQIRQAAGSTYNGYTLDNYGRFARDQIHARLEGEKAECLLSGAKLLDGEQHSDSCILIEHLAPNCHSNQNYRNVLHGQSRGVFQGKVHVYQAAQQTDGYQLCNSILLSDRAEMDTKPELEIYTDDVQCSHGATTACLDEDPLFYLQARGIDKKTAQAMLLEGFVNESLEALEDNEDVYEQLTKTIAQHCHA